MTRFGDTISLGGKPVARTVALAPLTRLRNTPDKQVPTDLHVEYYKQRASKNGLLITEATFIAREAGGTSPTTLRTQERRTDQCFAPWDAGYPYAPGLYNDEQIEAWKKVTSAVHDKEGLIYTQLWALGRANCDPPLHDHLPDVVTVGPSAGVGLKDEYPPKELSIEDIQRYIGHYRQAALNADKAGFDGVEVHHANGYLPDQFLQSSANKRTDAYGGSLENRARFGLEAVAAAVDAIGQERVGVRLSPWGTFQGMGERNPYETFGYVVSELTRRFPRLAYVHFVKPREWFPEAKTFGTDHLDKDITPSNDRFRAIIRGLDPAQVGDDETYVFPDPTPERPTVVLEAGAFGLEDTRAHTERTGDLVAIGRSFISNPDLPARLVHNVPLAPYNRDTFYTHGAEGYVDYPSAEGLRAQA